MENINFDELQPVLGNSGLKKTFAVVGKELSDKQVKAGYYLAIAEGDKIDGLYMGIAQDPQYGQDEVTISDDKGNLTIIKSCASLKKQLSEVEIGSPVRLIYKGKVTMKKGKYAGKQAVNWLVLS